jgi:hypothetical protein
MTIATATKKLNKAGFTVNTAGNILQAVHASTQYVIEFFKNGSEDSICCINVRHLRDHHDSQSDYCAGSFADNITQAIRRALSH